MVDMDTDFDDWLKEEVDTSELGSEAATENFDDIFDIGEDIKNDDKKKERTLSSLLADADDILAGMDDFTSGEADEDIKLESLDLKSFDVGDDILDIDTTKQNDNNEDDELLEWDPTQDEKSRRRNSAGDKGRLIESELQSDTCDADTLRALCADGVPSNLRSKIWFRLLMAQEIEDIEFRESKVSDTISKACLSVAQKVWKKSSALEISKQMASMLNVYDSNVDEIVATNSAWLCVPLYMSELQPTPSQNERLAMYEELRNCVVPIRTTTKERGMFRKLLAYHDPELSLRFEKDVKDVEHCLSDALSTMFMRTCCQEDDAKAVLRWFECLFVNREPTPIFRHFLSLSLLHRSREELLKSKFESIEKIRPSSQSQDSIFQLVHLARAFETSTPLSCRHELEDDTAGKLDVMSGCQCLTVTAAEVLMSLGRQTKNIDSKSSIMRYFIVDCRTRKRRTCQIGYGRLSRAFAIDNTWLGGTKESKAQLESALNALRPMRGKVHIALVGASASSSMLRGMNLQHRSKSNCEVDSATRTVALMLVRQGFSYISVIRDGFESVSKYLMSRKELADLVDFEPGPSSMTSPSNTRGGENRTSVENKNHTVVTSAAAAQVMMKKNRGGAVTLGAVVDDGPSEIEVRMQKTVASVKSWSIGIGQSAKSTWGNLRERFKTKGTSSSTTSSTTTTKTSTPGRLEKSAGMFRNWIRDTTSGLSPSSFLSTGGGGGGESNGEKKKRVTKSKPKITLSSEERKEIALERHRLSGLRKGESIQILDIKKMCKRKFEACKMFSVKKLRYVDEALEPERVDRTFLLAAHRLLSLELDFDADMDTATGSATVKSNHHLTELKKLSYTKKDPTLIKLYYKGLLHDEIDDNKKMKVNSYRLQDSQAFVKALTVRLRALKMQ